MYTIVYKERLKRYFSRAFDAIHQKDNKKALEIIRQAIKDDPRLLKYKEDLKNIGLEKILIQRTLFGLRQCSTE